MGGLVELAPVAVEASEVAQDREELRHLAVLLHERKRLGVGGLGLRGVAAEERHRLGAARHQRELGLPVVGTLRRRRPDCEEIVGELDRRVIPAARLVDRPQRLAQVAQLLEVLPAHRVRPGRPEVVELGGGRLRRRRTREVREVAGMALASRLGEVRPRIELGRGVCLDRLEHDDAGHAVAVGRVERPDEALVEQRAEAVEGVELRAGRVVQVRSHRLDRLDRGSGEDRQQLEQPLLRGRQQLVAPLDRRAERLLALRQVAGTAAERLEAAGEPIPERLGREKVQPGRSQLDRQRQPVEPATDPGDRGRVVVGQPEVRPDAARPLDEQLDRLELAEVVGRGARTGRGRERQWRNRHHVLAPHAQRLAARHEHLEARAFGEQLDDRWRGDRDLLEVVENDQDLLCAEPAAELVERRAFSGVTEADRRCDEGKDRIAVGCGDEVDEVDAVGEPVDLVGGGTDGEPGLAAAAGTGERDESDVGVVQAISDGAEFRVAANERGCLGREVVRPEVEGRQRKELSRQPRKGKLEETLRPPEVLQSMLPEVAQRRAGREPALDEAGGRLGQQDLAAVTGRHDPRRPVHRGPKEVPAARLHLAGVDPHPHPDRAPVRPRLREQPVLSGGRGRHGADWNGEDGHESIAGRLDDLAARFGDRGPDDRLVPFEGRPHRLGVRLPQAGAALDVREQEGQRLVAGCGRRSVARLLRDGTRCMRRQGRFVLPWDPWPPGSAVAARTVRHIMPRFRSGEFSSGGSSDVSLTKD